MTMKPDEAAKVLRDVRRFLSDTLKDEEYESPIAGWIDGVDAAVAALEGMASAKPVSWLIRHPDGSEWECHSGLLADSLRGHNTVTVTPYRYAAPQPAYCCAKCGLADLHPRERALSQDAGRGNFRRAIPSGQDGIDGVHATDIIPAAAIVGDDDGAAIIAGA